MTVLGERRWNVARLGRYAASFAVAVLLPPLLVVTPLPFVHWTYSEQYLPFELLGMTAAIAALGNAAIELRGRWKDEAFVTVATLTTLVALVYVGFIAEWSVPSRDYGCYERALVAVLTGDNPWTQGYVYPPLQAELMAELFGAMDPMVPPTERPQWIFYVFQCVQLGAVLLAFPLCTTLGRKLGLSSVKVAVVVAALFVLNTPLFRTVRHDQINLWVLDLSLAAVLLADAFPVASGVLVGLGAHLKLYPLILLVPFTVSRRWRVLGAALVSLTFIFLLESNAGHLGLWKQFLAFLASFPERSSFRDDSINGAFTSLSTIFGLGTAWIKPVAMLVRVPVALWFALRGIARERSGAPPLLHAIDALAAALLLSPLVWEHHYVLALPIALAAIALRASDAPALLGLALSLVFAVPTFDVFPLSLNRLVGLILLLRLTGAPFASKTRT